MFSFLGKTLLTFGLFLVLVGILFLFGEKIPYFGKLPGDILIKREKLTFYFPLGTCLLISLVLSFVFYLISKFLR